MHEAQEKALLLQREKEASDIRVKEVEELLITKLQTISDLEEQLGEAVANGEDLEHRALSSEQNAENLTLELQKLSEARDELHEKTVTLEQRLSRTTTENAELKKRTESFDRLKKSISEASSHAHAILRTLDHGPKPSRSSFQPIDDQLIAPEQERSLFEEHFEQHELF